MKNGAKLTPYMTDIVLMTAIIIMTKAVIKWKKTWKGIKNNVPDYKDQPKAK